MKVGHCAGLDYLSKVNLNSNIFRQINEKNKRQYSFEYFRSNNIRNFKIGNF